MLRESNGKKKHGCLIAIGMAVLLLFACSAILGGSNSSSKEETSLETSKTVENPISSNEATEQSTEETIQQSREIDVKIDVIPYWINSTSVGFDINTNLPDETELMLSLSQGDYYKC